MIEFQKLQSLSRLFRDMTVTEKIDGTQSGIHFVPWDGTGEGYGDGLVLRGEANAWMVAAQSKNRIITPESDNYGFARWVHENAQELFDLLGEGSHYGEWWGQGIQRRYGQDHKNFSLFNSERYQGVSAIVDGALVEPVPVLYTGPFDTAKIEDIGKNLRRGGSVAAPGFMQPEGVVVFHHHSGKSFKYTLDANDAHKWEQNNG